MPAVGNCGVALPVANGQVSSSNPPKNWPARLNLAENNRHLDSVVASRSRPYRLHGQHAFAIRPPAFVKVALAVLNPEYKFRLSRCRWVVVERKRVRILSDLAVVTTEQ